MINFFRKLFCVLFTISKGIVGFSFTFFLLAINSTFLVLICYLVCTPTYFKSSFEFVLIIAILSIYLIIPLLALSLLLAFLMHFINEIFFLKHSLKQLFLSFFKCVKDTFLKTSSNKLMAIFIITQLITVMYVFAWILGIMPPHLMLYM